MHYRMLTAPQLEELNLRIATNADRLINSHLAKLRPTNSSRNRGRNPDERRGRPARRILNPLVGRIGPTTEWGRYPAFAMDILEGVARLDWHDREAGAAEASKPLSVRTLVDLLASVEQITTASIAAFIGAGPRHAQRYLKAIELAMPRLLADRPQGLIREARDADDKAGCPIHLRRMYIEKTYRALAKGEPLGQTAYCLMDQHNGLTGKAHYVDPDGLPRNLRRMY